MTTSVSSKQFQVKPVKEWRTGSGHAFPKKGFEPLGSSGPVCVAIMRAMNSPSQASVTQVVEPRPLKKARRLFFVLAGVAVIAVLGIYVGVIEPSMSKVQVGDQAPDFEATTHAGQTIRLSDFKGKKAVVLYFYPKDNTPVCTAQACGFRDAYEQFVTAGAEVIGVSSDSSQSHQSFATKQNLPFHLVSDPDRAIRTAFGVPKTFGFFPGRVTYIVDRQGAVRHIFNSQLNADGHIAESLRIVRELAAGTSE